MTPQAGGQYVTLRSKTRSLRGDDRDAVDTCSSEAPQPQTPPASRVWWLTMCIYIDMATSLRAVRLLIERRRYRRLDVA